jgi:hypothetical protein
MGAMGAMDAMKSLKEQNPKFFFQRVFAFIASIVTLSSTVIPHQIK